MKRHIISALQQSSLSAKSRRGAPTACSLGTATTEMTRMFVLALWLIQWKVAKGVFGYAGEGQIGT